MSRTTITNSGSQFLTNISSEQLIGKLCKISGAKYHKDIFGLISMPYDVTEEEANDISEKLLSLIDNSEKIFEECKHFFGKNTTLEDFKNFIQSTAKEFSDSKGYTCAS